MLPPEPERLTNARAMMMVEDLSLSRVIPNSVRAEARHQLYFHARRAPDLFSTWSAKRLAFVPPPPWHQQNPCITRLGDGLFCALRTVNVEITPEGPRVSEYGPLFSRTWLLSIDANDLSDAPIREIILPPSEGRSSAPGCPAGFEDMRIFPHDGVLWAMFTRCDQNEEGWPELWLAPLSVGVIGHMRRLHSPAKRRPEKNWIPFEQLKGGIRFVYTCDPTIVVNEMGKALMERSPDIAADHLRGSSQGLPFEDGLLALVHNVTLVEKWPRNMHRFVWFDNRFRLARISDPFVFPTNFDSDFMSGYQYGMGLCKHPDEKRLVVSYSVGECQAWLATIEAKEVSGKLRSCIEWQ